MTEEVSTDPLLTIRDLAKREGMTPKQVRNLVAGAGLPAYRIGGLLRVRLSEYMSWLEGMRR